MCLINKPNVQWVLNQKVGTSVHNRLYIADLCAFKNIVMIEDICVQVSSLQTEHNILLKLAARLFVVILSSNHHVYCEQILTNGIYQT